MPTEIIPAKTGEFRALTTAGTGTALTTTPVYLLFPEGVRAITVTPSNFSTTAKFQAQWCPYLHVMKRSGTFTAANLTDYTKEAQDGLAATVITLSSLPLVANNGFLYVGSHVPFRGLRTVVVLANGTVSVMTVKYWNGAWTDITATDNTASGGATLAVTGTITWTVPTDWAVTSLVTADGTVPLNFMHVGTPDLYWTRIQVSAALDSSTTLSSLIALNRSTAYWELNEGQPLNAGVKVGFGGYSGMELLVSTGTGNVGINGLSINDDMQGNLAGG